jgi:hypothetical protein
MIDKTQIIDINKRINKSNRAIEDLKTENNVSNERKTTDPLRSSLFNYFDEIEEKRSVINVESFSPQDSTICYPVKEAVYKRDLINIKVKHNQSVHLAKNFRTLLDRQQTGHTRRPSFKSFIKLEERNQRDSRQKKRPNNAEDLDLKTGKVSIKAKTPMTRRTLISKTFSKPGVKRPEDSLRRSRQFTNTSVRGSEKPLNVKTFRPNTAFNIQTKIKLNMFHNA